MPVEIDWQHVAETVVVGSATAGAAWATIKAELRSLHERVQRSEADTARAHARIDTILERVKA